MHYGATRSITVHVSASWCKEELNKAIKSNLVALGAIQNFMRNKANSVVLGANKKYGSRAFKSRFVLRAVPSILMLLYYIEI